GVDAGKLGEAISKVLAAGESRTVRVSVVTSPPSITDQDARAMGIKEKISSFTTQHPCCAPRVTNIQTIARILDGHIVKPGQTFSLNTVVGPRDRARGFVPAPMILNGRFVDDVGGGISQFVTTMFNAVFFAGLQDVQHMAHSYYISRYPAGRESTVSYPQPDFRWRNDSPHGVLIKTSYTGTSITVDFWGTKRYDIESQSSDRYAIKKHEEIKESGDDCVPMPGADGFSIDVYRIFKKDGRVVRKQKFHTVYLPEPKLTCEPKEGGD
ncbi:VanW family protein, partial [Actinomadura adrarensis]